MKKLLLLTIAFYTTVYYSQTKKIFHKSHSGKSATLFMDGKNNYGPGMVAPVRYRTPVSPIKLNYVVTDMYEYPLVRMDTTRKTLRFFDLKDSLLGCDRNYKEYMSHGDIVYDVISNYFYVYQRYFKSENVKPWVITEIFLPISDSIFVWEKSGAIRSRNNSFIRDGNNSRILMTYPSLKRDLTSNLKYYAPQIDPEAQPIQLDENIEKKEVIVEKTEKKRIKKLKKKLRKEGREKVELATPIFGNNFPKGNSQLLRWITFIMLFFSLFIFIGVHRIVKDELSKSK